MVVHRELLEAAEYGELYPLTLVMMEEGNDGQKLK